MSDYVGMHSQCCQECSRPQCGWCHNPWPCPTFELVRAQATIAQRDAQVAEWQREYVDQGKRFSSATERQIDTFKRLVREKIELREQLAARDAQVAELTAAGERLYIELDDAAFGYEGVYPRVQEDAKPVLEAWRELMARTPAAPEGETVRADG